MDERWRQCWLVDPSSLIKEGDQWGQNLNKSKPPPIARARTRAIISVRFLRGHSVLDFVLLLFDSVKCIRNSWTHQKKGQTQKANEKRKKSGGGRCESQFIAFSTLNQDLMSFLSLSRKEVDKFTQLIATDHHSWFVHYVCVCVCDFLFFFSLSLYPFKSAWKIIYAPFFLISRNIFYFPFNFFLYVCRDRVTLLGQGLAGI